MTAATGDLDRAMIDGVLIPIDYEAGLHRASDVLSDLLRREDVSLPAGPGDATRPALPEERVAILAYGRMIGDKLARLIEGVAELRGQAVEIAGVVGLLIGAAGEGPGEISGGDVARARVYLDLRSASDRIAKPYEIVTADGVVRGAADGDPEIADLDRRSLAIDGVHEVLWRGGQEISLVRRGVIRRFLVFFGRAPGVLFSKEEIVRSVWGFDYHPLRNDPALFASVMRVRRLVGEGGSDILRSEDGGYRFCPPADFLCLTRSGSSTDQSLEPWPR